MSGYELKTPSYNNPFAYKTSPWTAGAEFTPAHQAHNGETGTGFSPAQYAFGSVTTPAKKTFSNEELLTQAYDKNFVKDTFAYLGNGHPSLTQPESRADYDDSDYRGKMYYAA